MFDQAAFKKILEIFCFRFPHILPEQDLFRLLNCWFVLELRADIDQRNPLQVPPLSRLEPPGAEQHGDPLHREVPAGVLVAEPEDGPLPRPGLPHSPPVRGRLLGSDMLVERLAGLLAVVAGRQLDLLTLGEVQHHQSLLRLPAVPIVGHQDPIARVLSERAGDERNRQGGQQTLHDGVRPLEYPQCGLAVQSGLLEVDDDGPQTFPAQRSPGGPAGHSVRVEATEAGPHHHHQVSRLLGLPDLLVEVVPQVPVIANHRVGGVVPGAVDLHNVLLWPASLLREAVVVLLDPGVDQSSLLQGGESQVR